MITSEKHRKYPHPCQSFFYRQAEKQGLSRLLVKQGSFQPDISHVTGESDFSTSALLTLRGLCMWEGSEPVKILEQARGSGMTGEGARRIHFVFKIDF